MRHGLLTRVALPAAVTTAAATPLVRRLMLRAGTMDVPNHRSSHIAPTPRGGGLACLAGMAFGLRDMPTRAGLSVVALGLVGLGDDVSSGLSPAVRLAAQASLGLASAPRPLGALRGVVLVPAAVNIVNFMDGINGISGLSALVWGANAAAVSTTHSGRALGAAVAGAGLGFLPWNLVDAKIFLGDVGSYSLGAAMGVVLARATTFEELLRLGAPLTPYVMDSAQAILRRRRNGDSLHEAHREHAYQRLVDRTRLTHSQVALLHAAAAAACAVAASCLRPAPRVVVVTSISAAYALLPLRIEAGGTS